MIKTVISSDLALLKLKKNAHVCFTDHALKAALDVPRDNRQRV